MAETLPMSTVVAALQALGLAALYAQRAACDSRIVWTESALAACAHDVETSTMRKPERALWSTYLEHGQLPPLPYVAPSDDLRCPVPGCDADGDLAVCHGIHGYARVQPCWNCGEPLHTCWGRCPIKQEEAA